MAFGAAADGRLLLASGGDDGTVRVWDPVTGVPAGDPLTGHTGWVNSVAFGAGADGRLLLASAGNDEMVQVWDPVACAPVGDPLIGHTGRWGVNSVAFGAAADGRLLLASGGDDRTVRVWDVTTNACIETFRRRSRVVSVVMTGPLLAIGDDEGVCVIEPEV